MKVSKTLSLEIELLARIEDLARRKRRKFADVLDEVIRRGLEALEREEG